MTIFEPFGEDKDRAHILPFLGEAGSGSHQVHPASR